MPNYFLPDGSQAEEVDDTVSAAVSLVVGGARQGVVALCASVAHIMRERKRYLNIVHGLCCKMLLL